MDTYKVMLTNAAGQAKTSIVVAGAESTAMQIASMNYREQEYKAMFAVQMFKGSPAD